MRAQFNKAAARAAVRWQRIAGKLGTVVVGAALNGLVLPGVGISTEIPLGPFGIEEQSNRVSYDNFPRDCAPDDRGVVVGVGQDSDGRLHALRFDDDWNLLDRVTVTEQTASWVDAKVACDGRGGFVVAWKSDEEPCLQVRAYDSEAQPLSEARRLTPPRKCAAHDERVFQLDYSEGGRFRALWVTKSLAWQDASLVFRYRDLGDDGASLSRPIVLKRTTDGGFVSNREEYARANDEAALVLHSAKRGVIGQVVALDGTKLTDPFRVNAERKNGTASILTIEDLGDGTMTAWWSSLWQIGSIGRRINVSATTPPLTTTTTTLPPPEGNEPQFDKPARITNPERDAAGVDVAAAPNGTVAAVWLTTDGSYYDEQISLSRRTAAAGWSESRILAHGNSYTGMQPRIATDGDDVWVAMWPQGDETGCDFVASRSTDDAQSWWPAEPVIVDALVSWSYPSDCTNAKPVLVADGDIWIVIWVERGYSPSAIGPVIRMSRSTDDGQSWSQASTVLALDGWSWGAVALSASGDGNWLASLPLQSALGSSIVVLQSTDDGASWGSLRTIAIANEESANLTPYFLTVDVANDRNGNWLVAASLNEFSIDGQNDGDADIIVVRSTDDGASWSARTILPYAAGDVVHDVGPSLATDGEGRWLLAWGTSQRLPRIAGLDADIAVAESTDNGASWTRPEGLHIRFETDRRRDQAVKVVARGPGEWLAVWLGYNPFPNYDDAVFAATGSSK